MALEVITEGQWKEKEQKKEQEQEQEHESNRVGSIGGDKDTGEKIVRVRLGAATPGVDHPPGATAGSPLAEAGTGAARAAGRGGGAAGQGQREMQAGEDTVPGQSVGERVRELEELLARERKVTLE